MQDRVSKQKYGIDHPQFDGHSVLLFNSSNCHHSVLDFGTSLRVRCFLSYQAVFILMLLCTKWIHESWVIILLFLSSVSYIIMNAPVQHIYNPLSEYEKCENRRKLMKNLLLISIAFACFSLNKPHYAFTISYASAWNAACMALLKHSNMWRRS